MPEKDKKPTDWWGNLMVGALIAPIFIGPILAFYFNDSTWLWMCMTLIFFLS